MSKDAKPDAWMPLYIGDWDGDTGHLDCEQDGAYGRLVRHYWRTGPLPDDDNLLARIVRMQTGRWRKLRPSLAPFFVISDGRWNHKRVDAELIRWTEKRARAIERASAGGRAKAAKSSATSTQQALLKQCTSASSREVESPTGSHTLSGQNEFLGPNEVREAFVTALGESFAQAVIDRCEWRDLPERGLIPLTGWVRDKLNGEGRATLKALGLSVLERAA